MCKNLHIMTTKQSFTTILLPAIVGAGIGFGAATLLYQSDTCKAPVGVEQVETNDGSIRVRWQAEKNARGYLVWARDSSALESDSVASSITVTGNEAVIPGLIPNHGYLIEVFSICPGKDNKFLFSKAPFDLGARTGWIVIEDMADLKRPNCPFNTCDTVVNTNADTCFNWGGGDEYFSIEVFRIGAHGTETSPALRTYLEKSVGNNTLTIRNYKETPCSGADERIGDLPTKSKCAATDGCGSTLYDICGTLSDANGNRVCYGIKIDFANCCIVGLDKNRFRVVVKKCHFVPDDM